MGISFQENARNLFHDTVTTKREKSIKWLILYKLLTYVSKSRYTNLYKETKIFKLQLENFRC
jgi:hypothetical protein